MSDRESLSRLVKRGGRRKIVTGDGWRVDDLLERLKKSNKGRRGTSAVPARSLIDRLHKAQHQRGRPLE